MAGAAGPLLDLRLCRWWSHAGGEGRQCQQRTRRWSWRRCGLFTPTTMKARTLPRVTGARRLMGRRDVEVAGVPPYAFRLTLQSDPAADVNREQQPPCASPAMDLSHSCTHTHIGTTRTEALSHTWARHTHTHTYGPHPSPSHTLIRTRPCLTGADGSGSDVITVAFVFPLTYPLVVPDVVLESDTVEPARLETLTTAVRALVRLCEGTRDPPVGR